MSGSPERCRTDTKWQMLRHGSPDLKGEADFSMDGAYQLFSVIGGSGHIDGTPLKKGDHFILPTGYESYKLSGEMELMTSFTEGELYYE